MQQTLKRPSKSEIIAKPQTATQGTKTGINCSCTDLPPFDAKLF